MFHISNHYISKYIVLLVSLELLTMMAAFYLGAHIRFPEFPEQNESFAAFPSLFPQAVTFVFVMISSMAAIGMYQLDSWPDFKATLFRLMPSMVLGFGAMILVFYLIPEIYLGRGVLIIVMFLAFFGILLLRTIFFKWSSTGKMQARAIVLGAGDSAKELVSQDENDFDHRRPKIIGFIPFHEEGCSVPSSAVLLTKGSLISLARQYKASEIIVAPEERRGGSFPIQELLECKMDGIKITDVSTFFEREGGHIRMDSLYPSWLVFSSGFDQSLFRSVIKRIFDLVACAILLLVAIIFMLIAAFFILIEDGFPIFYRQERVGKGGKTFMVVKFRSMKKNAEQNETPQWATTDDPRVTRVGKIIRNLRIDELPQIINVLMGDMSLVGPRPERPYFVDMLCSKVPYYNFRHSVKPGITGWAQVRYPYGASVEDAIEKLQYDLYYVKNHSLFLDVIILISTIEVVIFGKGGR